MRPTFSVDMRSGRAQKRALERAAEKQRAGRRRARPADVPMIVKADYVLAPVEAVLAQIELRGTVDVLPDGTPIFQAADGSWCPTAGAIEGLADFFEMWAGRHATVVNVAPLRQLCAQFEYSRPVDDGTLHDVRGALPALRRIAGAMSQAEASSLIQSTQIKAEFDALAEGR